ncbi:replication endonuclease [[Enterobacter] lignolyticus]|uniref:Replication protein n=1 Tax=[Enterobacter] lignolyticus TaxID=1334193 RepID=A0A806X783_9ENTR|nr:replication endonuclease [[Enterobacter] lignolyticus]ALR77754.1 replication protein [[Enterobacter] lignolyticus]
MTTARFAFPWNAPRQAITFPELTWQEQYSRQRQYAALTEAQQAIALLPECLKREVYQHADWLESRYGATRARAFYLFFVKKTLPRIALVTQQWHIPALMRRVSGAVFHARFDGQTQRFIADRLVNLVTRYNQLPDMTKADVDLLSDDIAHFIRSELAHCDTPDASDLKTLHTWYMQAGALCQQFNITPPRWQQVNRKIVDKDQMAPAVMRMFNEGWWRTHLRRIAAQWREHLFIALGRVSQHVHTYASKNCQRDWREQKRRTREFLKGMELEDEEGNRINLIDKHDGSLANPAIRRCELMRRIRGFETICDTLGYVAEFYTLTAPAKFHATLRTGHFNPKWRGASPTETQRWFNRLWACIRAKLHRDNRRIFGIRVAEPHHDGTPHWHMLIFMHPHDKAHIRQVFEEYACQEEQQELTRRNTRFHAEEIDPKKGSATGYIAKYISKNIDGYALDNEVDKENGKPLKETAIAVSAWAARWHIRQFQFIGGAPVTVYRELRRLRDNETARGLSIEFADVHHAADNGDWADYVNAQGGPFVRRDALQVRTLYLPQPQFNRFGERIVSIRGVYDSQIGAGSPIITRTKRWKIVPRLVRSEEHTSPDAACTSWSSVNNCTANEIPSPAWDFSIPLNRRQRQKLTSWLRRTCSPGGSRPHFST